MSSVTVLGLGTMGAPMAGHLARAGHSVRGWNRTPGRAAIPGVTQVAALNEALSGADAVVLSVSDTPDVEELLLGANGAIAYLRAGAIVIDTS
ncbi:MAG: NAD(P)-dependent oxidoreductase, partial [Chloroflexi bacterium]